MSLLWQLSKVGTPSKSANWDGGGASCLRRLRCVSSPSQNSFRRLAVADVTDAPSGRRHSVRDVIGVMQFQSLRLFQWFHGWAHRLLRPVPNVQAVQPLRSVQNVNRISNRARELRRFEKSRNAEMSRHVGRAQGTCFFCINDGSECLELISIGFASRARFSLPLSDESPPCLVVGVLYYHRQIPLVDAHCSRAPRVCYG